ncbi:MAG: hypothetical protein AABX32_02125 [Nanoarchaeota archaeon]
MDIERLTRREATRLMLVGGLYTAANPIDAAAQYSQSLSAACTPNLRQVRNGAIHPMEYLSEKERCMPEIIAAKRSGELGGILYEPTDQEVEAVLRQSISKKIQDPDRIAQLVRANMESYLTDKSKERIIAKITPSVKAVFGEGHPHYIIITGNLTGFEGIVNDEDVHSVLRHELEHITDYYHGIRFGDMRLSFSTLMGKPVSADFMHHLLEVRATYKELKSAFYQKINQGKSLVSPRWLGHQSRYYTESWNYLKQNAQSDVEREISKLQLDEVKGIMPEMSNGALYLTFNLFGKKERLRIISAK